MLSTSVALQDVLRLVVTTLDARDPYTFEHSFRVAQLADMVAEELGLPPETRHTIYVAANLHDIGKVAVADDVLNKPGLLNPREYTQVQAHPLVGYDVLRQVPSFRDAAVIVRHHHERWDGQGYPDGLAGTDIPLAARIIALADAFDAITSDRPYRRRLSCEQGVEEILRQGGRQFCPDCAAAFGRLRSRIKVRLYHSNRSLAAERLNGFTGVLARASEAPT